MTSEEKIAAYELQIEDMLHTIEDRLGEFVDVQNLSEFEQGRQVAYIEMMDIIKTRHKILLDVLE